MRCSYPLGNCMSRKEENELRSKWLMWKMYQGTCGRPHDKRYATACVHIDLFPLATTVQSSSSGRPHDKRLATAWAELKRLYWLLFNLFSNLFNSKPNLLGAYLGDIWEGICLYIPWRMRSNIRALDFNLHQDLKLFFFLLFRSYFLIFVRVFLNLCIF